MFQVLIQDIYHVARAESSHTYLKVKRMGSDTSLGKVPYGMKYFISVVKRSASGIFLSEGQVEGGAMFWMWFAPQRCV
jgi:hypothetical protein